MGRWLVILFVLVIWIYILTIFNRKKQGFFYFLTGSVGLFAFSYTLLSPIVTFPLARLVCYLTGLIGRATGSFTAYSSYAVLFIENMDGPISLYIDFECAGLIEILVFISLLIFFKAYKWYEKFWVGFLGVLIIFVANIIRLLSICFIIHQFGNESYYLAHTIVGRLIFYAISISLYFYVFTRRQIKRQNVGEFNYNENTGE